MMAGHVTFAWAVFVLSVGLPLYVILGYPALLAVFPFRCRPLRKAPTADPLPTVTVLLPVHNGERWIRGKLESIAALDYPPDRLQVLVISDGSTDGTSAMREDNSPRTDNQSGPTA